MPVERVVPMMLFDQSDDWPEICWIEALVGDEDAARDALAEHCVGEMSDSPPFRPVGPAVREWHRRTDRIVPDGEVWEKCDEGDDGAVEFWKVVVD